MRRVGGSDDLPPVGEGRGRGGGQGGSDGLPPVGEGSMMGSQAYYIPPINGYHCG